MTKKEFIEALGTSKGTLYRHMNKLGIDKGSDLTEEEIKLLTKSIGKKSRVPQNETEQNYINNETQTLLEKQKRQIEKLEKKISLLDEKIIFLEKDNRNLLEQLTNSTILHNEVNKQFSEYVIHTKSLMAPKENNQNVNDVHINTRTEPNADNIDNKKKKEISKHTKKRWWNKI